MGRQRVHLEEGRRCANHVALGHARREVMRPVDERRVQPRALREGAEQSLVLRKRVGAHGSLHTMTTELDSTT